MRPSLLPRAALRAAAAAASATLLLAWLGLALGATASGSANRPDAPRASHATSPTSLSQPAPPVSASDFPIEPRGHTPRDGDGLIPNARTPTGSAAGPVTPCDYTADTSTGATSATVNAVIAAKENSIRRRYVICLRGTFTSPIHVWSKWSEALLVIESAPGAHALLALGQVKADDVDPNDHDGGIVGGVDLTDSRDVEVEGLTISGYRADGPTYAPAGILITVRAGPASDGGGPGHESACFVKSADHTCSGIYLLDDSISRIVNRADEASKVERLCNDANVGAFGIAVLSYGNDDAHALEHVVIEGDTVDHTRTGQSETVTVNGDVEDFLEAHDTVYDTDNIGMDAIGWEEGTDQARHGIIEDDTVADVDTYGNHSYGKWSGGTCRNLPENAAGIYDDGASYLWIRDDVVDNTNQGIDADVETPGRHTDHILVSGNDVVDDAGTSLGVPSYGSNPPGVPGRSTVAGHSFEAFYVDSYGPRSYIEDVYAHDNTFDNASRYYGATASAQAPVVDVAGTYEDVMMWDNRVTGGGSSDPLNPLLELDNWPQASAPDVFDCTSYQGASAVASGAGNFVDPANSFLRLASWHADNDHGYDADSRIGSAPCGPART